MKLYGSTTSPFVRRLRLLLNEQDYVFVNMDIFSAQARTELTKHNPAQKVPYIEDEGQFVYDSRVIFNYLTEKLSLSPLSWEQQNTLTLIDAATDSLVQLLLLNRSGLNTDDDKMYFSLQKGRIREVLATLNQLAKDGQFEQWHYPAICLFSTIDWIMFRELFDLTAFAELNQFWQSSKSQPRVKETDPRL